MKLIGLVLISVGIAIMLFVGYSFFKQHNRVLSPIPEDRGVKVIFVTPTP